MYNILAFETQSPSPRTLVCLFICGCYETNTLEHALRVTLTNNRDAWLSVLLKHYVFSLSCPSLYPRKRVVVRNGVCKTGLWSMALMDKLQTRAAFGTSAQTGIGYLPQNNLENISVIPSGREKKYCGDI